MAAIVLVHGAWHGAWCWDGVVQELADAKVQVVAVELPLTGFTDDVAATRTAIESAGDGVVVCAHSYGGVVVSQAVAGLPGVSRIVYLAAFQTEPGEDPAALLASHPTPLLSALAFDARGMTVQPDRAHQALYADSTPEVAAQCVARLRPMPLDLTPATVTVEPAWKTVPSTYVICTNDQAIMPTLQRMMAARADDVVEWPTDHSPFLTRPRDIADLLRSYLDT